MSDLTRDQAIAIIKQASTEADTYGEECGDVAERSGVSTGIGIAFSPIMEHFSLTWDDIYSE